jgi:hypothetical protein
MELDNIMYIVIAIVLAIVNAVVQKKKKAAQQQKVVTPTFDDMDEQFDEADNLDPAYQAQSYTDLPRSNPLDILFGKESFPNEFNQEKEATIVPEPLVNVNAVSQPSDYELRMQAKANEFLEFQPDQNTFDFDEESISSSAIGNALTLEEEEEAHFHSKSLFMKEFDPKKAILYSEVIKPKYFSIGVIN